MREIISIELLVLPVVLAACGSGGGTGGTGSSEGEVLVDELQIVEVDDPTSEIAFVVTSPAKERLVVIADKAEAGEILKLTGGSYVDAEGRSSVFWLGDDGLPSEATASGLFFRFSNYTEKTVDVVVRREDGRQDTLLDIAVDVERVRQLRDALTLSRGGGKRLQGSETADLIRNVGLAISVGCCAGSIAATATGVGAAIGAVGIIGCCRSALLGVVVRVTDSDMLGTGALAISALNCATLDAGACLGLGLEAAAREIEVAEGVREDFRSPIGQPRTGSAEISGEFADE